MIVHVALAIPLMRRFSYFVPPPWEPFAKPFSRVRVPFGARTATGFIAEIDDGDATGLKEVNEVIDPFPQVGEPFSSLCRWAADYYVTPLGVVLKHALPGSEDMERHLTVTFSGQRCGEEPVPFRKALKQWGRLGLFNAWEEGKLEFRDIFTGIPFTHVTFAEQEDHEATLFRAPIKERVAYYRDLVGREMARGNNTLMLLPDYHVSGKYFEGIFKEAFPGRVVWHTTAIPAKSRMETYFRARNEEPLLILGNKGSVFLPMKRCGLIIVEKPEEEEYRNEESFHFNAATVAFRRASSGGVPVVFGSVAPSLEMMRAAQEKTLKIIERPLPQTMVKVSEIITERSPATGQAFSEQVAAIIDEALKNNNTVVVYTPRKDYASRLQCLECRHLFLCHSCGGTLSYQKEKNLLSCPGCGRRERYEEKCPQCGSEFVDFSNTGAEYLQEKFRDRGGDYPVFRVTGDTPKKDLKAIGRATAGPAVIVGTQILSRLFEMKADKLFLLGWEDLLRTAGYRAEEKMYQVLSGLLDAIEPKELYIVMEKRKRIDTAAFFRPDDFYAQELEKRRIAEFPPFVRLFLVEIEKKNEAAGTKAVGKVMENLERAGLLGSTIGPLMQKRVKSLWHIIVRGQEPDQYRHLLDIYNMPGVRIEADPLYV